MPDALHKRLEVRPPLKPLGALVVELRLSRNDVPQFIDHYELVTF